MNTLCGPSVGLLKTRDLLEQDERLHAADASAVKHPRYGYRRIAALLRQEGWNVGKRHIQRLRRADGLRVPPASG